MDRLHYEPHFWNSKSASRFKRHLPAIPKRKDKDSTWEIDRFQIAGIAGPYSKHSQDKYGSISGHSTSAIYGVLRAPLYRASYDPADKWYASVRSLNSGINRDAVYNVEAYEWRKSFYQEISKDGLQIEKIPRPACMCVIRRRHELPKSSKLLPRCKLCTPAPVDGVLNGKSLSTKRRILLKKKSVASGKEKSEPEMEMTSRMSSYKKSIIQTNYKNPLFKDNTAKNSQISRKSILESDITAYDLIDRTKPLTEMDESDVDDNLSDNIVARMNQLKKANRDNKIRHVPSSSNSRQPGSAQFGSKFIKRPNENCVLNESYKVTGGERKTFTNSDGPKSPDLNYNLSYNPFLGNKLNFPHNLSSGQKTLSESNESICIPDPDYDLSDSDDSTVINSNLIKPRFTYSPPPVRKSIKDKLSCLGYNSREMSKSMSCLQSDDQTITSKSTNAYNRTSYLQNFNGIEYKNTENNLSDDDIRNNAHCDEIPTFSNILNSSLNKNRFVKNYELHESIKNDGLFPPDYPTWTSSSSNELKSILKNKTRHENSIQEPENTKALCYFDEFRDIHRRKQVQFRPGSNATTSQSGNLEDKINDDVNKVSPENRNDENSESEKPSYIVNNTYETIDEVKNESYFHKQDIETEKELSCDKGEYISINDLFALNEVVSADCKKGCTDTSTSPVQINMSSNLCETPGIESHSSKLLSGRCSSFEDIKSTKEVKDSRIQNRRRRRTTLPKRRFSDLHLNLLLCPIKSSLCGNSNNSDDLPLTQRTHRSLPDSPSEVENAPSFCFHFTKENTKNKVLTPPPKSVFYVSVDGDSRKRNSNDANPEAETVLSTLATTSHNQSHAKDNLADVNSKLSQETSDTEDKTEEIQDNLDPIYQELSEVSTSSKRILPTNSEQKSFFEGASKTDILSYLADAKERSLTVDAFSEDEKILFEEDDKDEKVPRNEGTTEKTHVMKYNSINHTEILLEIEEDTETENLKGSENTETEISKASFASEVERNDSGVGTETSKPPRLQVLPVDWEEQLCADCDHPVEVVEEEDSGLLFSPLVCQKCEFKRTERKEIIIEFVDTELKYGRDLRIIKEEFYRPMEIAGLLVKEQLLGIFLNLDELTAVNAKFSEKLQDALDIATEHGDEDYTTVNIGKIFLETSSMLHAFETYCVKQASASVLLSNLQREKELLRIFLRVSQMENALLRRMNLQAFLMVPVQRVTRYPLLLSRLHKVTPIHHKDRSSLKEAQQKVELHLEHINQQTQGTGGTKIWRRISNISGSHRRLGKDIGNIKLRKMALEILNWKQDEARIVIAGKLFFTQITEYPWNKKGKTIKFSPLHALLVALGKPNSNYRPDSLTSDMILFPRNTGIKDASLILIKEKNAHFIIIRDPLYLGNCVISCEAEKNVFEIQEYTTKEAYLLKGETKKDTKEWLRLLQYHAKDLGTWRKRRNALANIMINGMTRQY